MAQTFWDFNYAGVNKMQPWTVPAGILSFQAVLYGATGGAASSTGGVPTGYTSWNWASSRAYENWFGHGSNLAGCIVASFTAPLSAGVPTWPGTLYVAVGGNGANTGSGTTGGAGGWPGGGNGGNGYGSQTTGGGGGGGYTALSIASSLSTSYLVAVSPGAGGTGGLVTGTANAGYGQAGVWSSPLTTPNPPYSSWDGSPSVNPTYITGTSPSGTFEGLYATAQMWEAIADTSTQAMGGAPLRPGGTNYTYNGSAYVAGGGYGRGATATAGGAAGNNVSGGTAPAAGAALTGGAGGSATSSTSSAVFATCGGGGGGGGWFGGGGGACGAYGSAGGGGGGSFWAATAAVGALPAPAGVANYLAAPPEGGAAGKGGYALFLARVYPLTPTVSSSSVTVATNASTSFTITQNHAAASRGVLMQAYRVGVKQGSGSIVYKPVVSLATPGTSATFTINPGDFAAGTYTLYIDTQDTGGDWNSDVSSSLAACVSAQVALTVFTPPPAPTVSIGTITSNYTDANGVVGPGVPVSWTQSAGTQVSAIVSLLAPDGSVVNTITLTGSTASTTLSWPESVSLGNSATVQYAVTAGQYSPAGSHTFDINTNPPAAPSVTMTLDSANGVITLNMQDTHGTYAVDHFDLYRSEAGATPIRIATNIAPNASGLATYTDMAVATDTAYSYIVRAFSQPGGYVDQSNGTVTGS